MSTHDRQEEELKKQIEKIAESVKEKGQTPKLKIYLINLFDIAAEASEANAGDQATDEQASTQGIGLTIPVKNSRV